MLTIENGYSGYEIIDASGKMLCRVETLEAAALARSFLAGEEMTEEDKETARNAIRSFDESMQARHEAYEQKRRERQERAAARKHAKAETGADDAGQGKTEQL